MLFCILWENLEIFIFYVEGLRSPLSVKTVLNYFVHEIFQNPSKFEYLKITVYYNHIPLYSPKLLLRSQNIATSLKKEKIETVIMLLKMPYCAGNQWIKDKPWVTMSLFWTMKSGCKQWWMFTVDSLGYNFATLHCLFFKIHLTDLGICFQPLSLSDRSCLLLCWTYF